MDIIILCFNTSHVTLYRGAGLVGTDPMAFQYISCYSLSLFRLWFLFAKSSFNTSHVTLYQGHNLNLHEQYEVSIHLMLLFIACFFLTMVILVGFQYISCYSLSSKGGLYCAKINVSIHLMLLFIDTDGSAALKPYQFQYISCYSLSEMNIQYFFYL